MEKREHIKNPAPESRDPVAFAGFMREAQQTTRPVLLIPHY
jgi:hypothetical protein